LSGFIRVSETWETWKSGNSIVISTEKYRNTHIKTYYVEKNTTYVVQAGKKSGNPLDFFLEKSVNLELSEPYEPCIVDTGLRVLYVLACQRNAARFSAISSDFYFP